MATTTNYSWTTPDDTDLVKDGAAAIRTLGSSVDTTVKNLNPETTTGAIAYRGATANVKVALPIGTAGQVLSVNSGATAPEWVTASSGGMTLISTTNASASASIALTSIPGTYRSLRVVITDLEPATNNVELRMRINNNSGASNYQNKETSIGGGTFNFSASSIELIVAHSSGASNTLSVIDVPDYANTTTYKMVEANSVFIGFGVNGGNRVMTSYHNQLAAITELNFFMSSGNITSGKFELYGVK